MEKQKKQTDMTPCKGRNEKEMKLTKKVVSLVAGHILTSGIGGALAANGILKEAIVTEAAAPTIATLTFSDLNKDNNAISRLTGTWEAICPDTDGNDVKFSLENFNNNGWSASWTYITCGRRYVDSAAPFKIPPLSITKSV